MLTFEQKKQFSEILESLGTTLDISETQYNNAVSSYNAVGEWLSKDDSSLALYKPKIRPQGSFILGTMIKPVCEEDDLDIDLVCELTGKNASWTQYDLKHAIGYRIRQHETYKKMLDEEGRRCWTLKYSDTANYHMDILPSLVCNGYNTILEKSFSDSAQISSYDSLAIRITDKYRSDYHTQTVPEYWLKCNPFGYARWFFGMASLEMRKTIMMSESVRPVPKYQKERLPLQRAVQILKRHRDIMFEGSEHKPISIIITTLAARAYNKEESVIDALMNIVGRMETYIESKYDFNKQKTIKWISNPVNSEENFADKWVEYPIREQNFYKWINQVKNDVQNIILQRGMYNICNEMKRSFGNNVVEKAFTSLADNSYQLRENSNLKMSTGSGILSTAGSVVTKTHNFHGKD